MTTQLLREMMKQVTQIVVRAYLHACELYVYTSRLYFLRILIIEVVDFLWKF
jgi:hypothetical protein